MKKLFVLLFFGSYFLAFSQANYTALNGPYVGGPGKIIKSNATLVAIEYGTGVFRSTDNGATWISSSTGLSNYFIFDITRDDSNGKLFCITNNFVYTSADDGATWTLAANTGITNARLIRKSPTGQVYIVSSNRIVYRSTNAGVTWSQINTLATGNPTDFEINGSGHLFISAEGGGIYRSTDNGVGFTQLDAAEGIADLNVYSLVLNGNDYYALSNTDIYKTTSAVSGTTWTSAKTASLTDCCFHYHSHIEKDPAGSIYVFGQSNIWKTTDGGTNWSSIAHPYPGLWEYNEPYLESASIFYYGPMDLALFKTTDGGANWLRANTGFNITYSPDLLITSNNRLLYAPGIDRGLQLSIDDGASWDLLTTGVVNDYFYGLTNAGSTIYAYGNKLISSTDNGTNWSQIGTNSWQNLAIGSTNTFFDFTVVYEDPNYIHAYRKSTDGGLTSTLTSVTGMVSANESDLYDRRIFADASNNLYALIIDYSSGTTKWRIYKIDTSSGAATEIINVPNTNIRDFYYYNNKLYVLTSNAQLHISSDGGQTWTSKTAPTSNGRIKIISDNSFYILNTVVYLSNDAGNSWVNTENFSTLTFNQFVQDVEISSANYSYVAPRRGKIYKSNVPVVPPTAPSSLVSIGNDRNSIGILWNDNSSNENYFIIEVSEGNNTSYDSVLNTTRPGGWARSQGIAFITSINGAALKSSTTYFIRIKAVGGGGKSSPSNEISVTTSADCSATSLFPQNRSWTATTLNTSGVGVYTKLNQTLTGSSGFYSIPDISLGSNAGLIPLPPTIWAVGFEENCGSVFMSSTNSYISNGNGTWDATNKVLNILWQTHPQYPLRTETTRYTLNATDPVPGAPTDLAATLFLPGTILLNWFSGSFTAEFEVERSTVSGSGFTKIATITFPTIAYKDVDPNLIAGTTYYYRIRAKNASGVSVYTAEVSIIPRSNYRFLPIDNLPSKIFSRTGGGGSWGDVDGDGINDLALPIVSDSTGLNLAPPIILKSLGNGQFVKYPIAELVDEVASSRMINIVDVNNDGLNDIHLSRSNTYDLLLIKNSDGSYSKTVVSDMPVVAKGIAGSSWVDYDSDSDLDLLITSRVSGFTAPEVFLFNNDGTGALTRITEGELVTDLGYTGDAEWADYDNDGDQDVLILNQQSGGSSLPCRLYANNGDGTFTRVLGSAFENAGPFAARSASWGDIDNDGDLDVFISELGSIGSKLFSNQGNGTFTEVIGSVLNDVSVGFAAGSGWADLDNDQDLDLVVTGTTPAIYYNNGTGTFTKYATQEMANALNLNKLYGVAFEDVDNDGFLDFFYGGFSNPEIPNIVFRNTTASTTSTKWLKVNLQGTTSNRSAVGARVTLTAGSKTQIREVQSHTGHTTQSSPTQHFGLGNNATAASLVVKWPSGIIQTLNNVSANQSLLIVEDGDGPAPTAFLPGNGASNVSSSTLVEITLNEGSTPVAAKNLVITKLSDPATTVFSAAVTSATKTGNKYSFTLPSKLEQGVVYRVRIDAGAFIDVYNNPSLVISESAWSFTIGQGPQLTGLSPLNNAVNVNTTTKLDLTFNGPVTGVAGKFLKVFKQGDLVNVITSIETNQAVITGNTCSFTLANKLALSTQYTIGVDAGAFIDAVQNESASITAGAVWSFTSSAGPLVSTFAPVNGVENVSITQSLSMTFNTTVTAVPGKSIRVGDGTTNYLTIDAAAATLANTLVTIAPPIANWPYLKTLLVTIDEGAFIDNAGNDFAGIKGATWSFKTVEAPDVTTPVLTYNPEGIATLDKGFSPVNISVSATDNKAVTTVTMHHRKLSEASFKTVPLTAPGTGTNWTSQVTNTMADDMGFEYYFEASDATGNIARNPAGTAVYNSSIRFTSTNAPKINLSGEGTIESWRIISVPYELENGNFQIADVFQSFGAAGDDSWRLIRYNKTGTTEKWLEYPEFSDLERGKGYFINAIGAKEVVFNNATSPDFNRSNLFQLNLVAGWNQIGNPYTIAINWEDVRTFNNVSSNVGSLKQYANGQYTNGNTLQVGQGGFVNVQSPVTISVPMPGQTSGARMQSVFSKDLASASWQVPLIVEQQYISNEFAGIGMHPQASASYDEFDDFNAPRFFDFAEINFSHPEHFQGRFARDIVATAKAHTWSFTVNSNLEDMAVIRWDNSSFGDNRMDLVLVDETTLLVIDMRLENGYSFDPKESRNFKIYFGEGVKDEISAQEFVMGQAYPNPTTGETKIRFSLPQKGGENQLVKVSVKDALGKDLGTVHSGTFTSGYHELSFDAAAWQATDGLLLMTVGVSNSEGKSFKQIKVMVKK